MSFLLGIFFLDSSTLEVSYLLFLLEHSFPISSLNSVLISNSYELISFILTHGPLGLGRKGVEKRVQDGDQILHFTPAGLLGCSYLILFESDS